MFAINEIFIKYIVERRICMFTFTNLFIKSSFSGKKYKIKISGSKEMYCFVNDVNFILSQIQVRFSAF